MKRFRMAIGLMCVAAFVLGSGTAFGAVNITALGDNQSSTLYGRGWGSDDTRADSQSSSSAGTNLIGLTKTDQPEATDGPGTAAMDAEIDFYISFGAAPGTVPTGTWAGAVKFSEGVGAGKAQMSHRKDDATGWFTGSDMINNFSAYYNWYRETSTGAPAAAFKLGFKTSEFGGCGNSSRTGEDVWDKIIVYEPYQNGHSPQNTAYVDTWVTETMDWDNGNFWCFDRATLTSSQGNPQPFAVMYSDNIKSFQTATCGTDSILTSVQFGIGSGNENTTSYVNEFQTSVYLSNTLIQFGSAGASCPGDCNGDGVVNLSDLSILSAQWGSSGPEADLNSDGNVNLSDLSILSADWGCGEGGGGGGGLDATGVPLPSAVGAGLALLGLAATRRRR